MTLNSSWLCLDVRDFHNNNKDKNSYLQSIHKTPPSWKCVGANPKDRRGCNAPLYAGTNGVVQHYFGLCYL